MRFVQLTAPHAECSEKTAYFSQFRWPQEAEALQPQLRGFSKHAPMALHVTRCNAAPGWVLVECPVFLLCLPEKNHYFRSLSHGMRALEA